jgi:hypothetical protein
LNSCRGILYRELYDLELLIIFKNLVFIYLFMVIKKVDFR